MKKILFFSILSTSLFFVACTKKTVIEAPPTNTNPNPIVGLWVGTFQITGATNLGSFYQSFSLFPDSTLIEEGGGSNGQMWLGKGTWSLKGTAWSATITNGDISQGTWTQQATAKYDSVAGTLSQGALAYTTGGSGSITFSLKRVN
ncbi:MAG: hypothetical protein ABUM51_00465 [Bacteroidota bacterium]